MMIMFNVMFAAMIAYGVVYNAARIVLSERSRDLASLRVSASPGGSVAILVGELAVIVVLRRAGRSRDRTGPGRAGLKASESELYRFPLIVTARTRVFAVRGRRCWPARCRG